ncbi:MAG: FTR1 family iron permease [Deltaproteobacteria bacterium]|nr:FTR1 family iron permease [Deltaproteobacteria bacterium]
MSVYISADRKTELESMFSDIRNAVSAHASVEDVRKNISLLMQALENDAKKLPEKGEGRKESPYTVFFNSLIIILREGFEAILVISAISAYLAKTGQKGKVKTVYKGAVLALIASIFTAILLQTVIRISGAGKEALEGITMLIAAAVLFYVSYWLITKIEVARWQHYIKSKVESSLTKGNVLALGFAAFLAVYREGAETILFYQALYSGADAHGSAIIAGFAAGSLLLIGLFILIKYGSVRIPIGPFFAITSTLLYYLAFTFAGKGIRELQEALWISSTPVEWLPTISFLGIYPTWEGMLLQVILILALIAAIVYSFILRPYKEMITVTNDISHIESDIKNLHDALDDVSRHAMTAHGLASGIAGQETEEIRKHLIDIDKKVHEVAGHLDKLAKGIEDIFAEMERDIKRG